MIFFLKATTYLRWLLAIFHAWAPGKDARLNHS
jgi:hypothetical protein